MGSGDLNSKKSWHVNNLKNQRRVWEAEQQALAERKKTHERVEELRKERQEEELARQLEAAGGTKRVDRVDWMYQGPSAENGGMVTEEAEAYLLGKRRIDGLVRGDERAVVQGTTGLAKVTAAVESGGGGSGLTGVAAQRDLALKIREDPLLAIKRREQAAFEAAAKDPLQRRTVLASMGLAPVDDDKKKSSRSHRHHSHHHRRRDDDRDDRDRHSSRRDDDWYRSRHHDEDRHRSRRDDDRHHRSRRDDDDDRRHKRPRRDSPSPRRKSPSPRRRSPSRRSSSKDRGSDSDRRSRRAVSRSRSPRQSPRKSSPPRRTHSRSPRRETNGRRARDSYSNPNATNAANDTNATNAANDTNATTPDDRARKLAAMQADAAALDVARAQRLAALEAREAAARAEDDRARAAAPDGRGVLGTSLRRRVGEMGLAERLGRGGRQGLQRVED